MENVNIRIYPDSTYGYVVEVYNNVKSIPVVVFGNLEKAFAMVETKSFSNFVDLFFND
jgi:hypothetical protein